MKNEQQPALIRDRVIKEIAVKFLVAGIAQYGLSKEAVETSLNTAREIYDYQVPKPTQNGVHPD